jgi:hypothetical protein
MRLLEMFCAALAILLAVGPLTGRELCHDNALAEGADRSRLLLYAKHPDTWKIVAGGARAEIHIERKSGRYEITAEGLAAETLYVLGHINAGNLSGELVGAGSTDRQGRLEFCGTWRNWQGKFWLVPGSDIRNLPASSAIGARLELKAWHPSRYLFEAAVMR